MISCLETIPLVPNIVKFLCCSARLYYQIFSYELETMTRKKMVFNVFLFMQGTFSSNLITEGRSRVKIKQYISKLLYNNLPA